MGHLEPLPANLDLSINSMRKKSVQSKNQLTSALINKRIYHSSGHNSPSKREIKTGNVFPVLLNLSLPTILSNPPLEFDPIEMMKETLPYHTQPSKFAGVSTNVFFLCSHLVCDLLPAPTLHNNELKAEIEVMTLRFWLLIKQTA